MHDTAYRIGGLAMRLYCNLADAAILEVGAQNVNGSLRDFALPATRYTGLDIEPGDGVDLVMEIGKPFPVEDGAFDMVMATSVFEHDPAFWMTFVEMCRKARPGGYVYINAPSNGAFHQYPQDHWRFYPDCGIALVEWARSQGQEMALVETFVAERESGDWNDFVAVFRRNGGQAPLPDRLISDEVASTNVRTWRSDEISRHRVRPEDMEIIAKWRKESQRLERELGEMQQQLQEKFDQANRLAAHNGNLEQAAAIAQQELDEARARLSLLESALAQRQEELAQAYAELAGQKEEYQALKNLLSESEQRQEEALRKRVEADGWVFRLAAERKEMETQLGRLQRKLDNADTKCRQLQVTHDRALAALERLHVEKDEAERRADEAGRRAEGADHAGRLAEELEVERGRLNTRFEEIAALTRMLREKEDAVSAAQERSRTDKEAADRRIAELESACGARTEEIAAMSRLLGERDSAVRVSEEQSAWLREVAAVLLNGSGSGSLSDRLASILPAPVRIRRQKARLKSKGIFDAEAYLAAHPDVAEGGMDPLRHYIIHGMHEGRQPF